MQTACEGGEVLSLLEGGWGGACTAAAQLGALFGAVREPWLARALLAYHARTGSARVLDVLARAPEQHARHLLDALLEALRGERAARRHALAALAPLVARRPAWLRLAAAHGVVRELLRAARTERDAAPQLHALLALAALVPAAPALAHAHAAELAEGAVRAASGGGPHAALAARALFLALYATHPCTALEALRGAAPSEACAAALAAGVRLHPALLAGSRAREADAARWARVEPHDVVAECRRLSLPAHDPPAPPAPPPPPARSPRLPSPGCAAQRALSVGLVSPGGEGWWSLGEVSGAGAAPHTPLPADEPEPEPEPAVEATPENTPRLAFRFPGEGGSVAARLARVAAERRALHSPVPLGGAPEPARPDSPEDSEVRALTCAPGPRCGSPPDWAEPAPAAAPAPRAPRRPRAPPAAPPARPASAPPAPAACTRHAAVQTVDTWPEPYEFLVTDLHRASPLHQGAEPSEPSERLDAYLAELYSGAGAGAGRDELCEQLALAHAQLMYERWRREAHAERNRRLLGRCRQGRALELQHGALQERVRALTRERDALRARARREPAAPEGGAEHARALEEELRAERGARLRAEAARHEAEAARARDQAELQRARAQALEGARHVEGLARAALLAERRGEHVRRLRRELLVLAERDARLAAACSTRTDPPPSPLEGALRAATARAEGEAAAAGARADAAVARAADLETTLAARDAALAELKRAARNAAEEGAACARALRDKYAALRCVVRAREARHLERLAAPSTPTPAPAPAPTDNRA